MLTKLSLCHLGWEEGPCTCFSWCREATVSPGPAGWPCWHRVARCGHGAGPAISLLTFSVRLTECASGRVHLQRLLPKLLFAAPCCLEMLLPAKAFSPSCVWEPALTKTVKSGEGVEPLPAALTPCTSPGAGLNASDPAQLRSAAGQYLHGT